MAEGPETPVIALDDLEACRLGETDGVLEVYTGAQALAVCLALVRQARLTVDIFSRELDPVLFDTPEFVAAVRDLATGNRRSQVRILVQRPEAVVRRGHRLLELSRRLSSFIALRRPPESQSQFNEAFLIVDGQGMLHRQYADRFEGQASFHAPQAVRDLSRWFDQVWEHATPDTELRRLHV